MNEAIQTAEGWYALHDFRSFDWSGWRRTDEHTRRQALESWQAQLSAWQQLEANEKGSTAIYRIVGQKAEVLFMHMRPTLEELQATETAFNRSAVSEFFFPAHSYVSVVELSGYLARGGDTPEQQAELKSRLEPKLPKTNHICFYPMDKRRDGNDNWYMLDMDKRKELMRSHSMIGRSYTGRVKQIITGSIGYDDWEWGVTLFADDPLTFKKLIYEMRFDEVSARYGDFGTFFVGNRADEDAPEQQRVSDLLR